MAVYILHLSDLHFGTQADATLWHSQLCDDLKHLFSQLEPDHTPQLNALILSGDIANQSSPSEYEAAELFVNRLFPDFGLRRAQIVIVPGNHDLNWQLADDAYKPVKLKQYQEKYKDFLDQEYLLDNDLIVDGNYLLVPEREQYEKRFKHFSAFYEKIIGQAYPFPYKQQYRLQHFPEQNILILGLNSAWKLNHHSNYKSLAGINPDALTNAINQQFSF